MNLLKRSLTLGLLWQPCLAELFPNGDFENGNTSWEEVSGGAGTFAFSYPTNDGNTGGFGVIDQKTSGGFGIWVGNDGNSISLDSLGLEAGNSYNFSQDMQLLSGSTIGGLKLDFTTAGANTGSSGEIFPDLIGDGSTWETYTFEIAIPLGVDGFKLVPLWGTNSSVGFDNISYNTTGGEAPLVPNGDFENGSTSWFQEGTDITFAYPSTGGNPDGHGRINSVPPTTGTGFWAANGGAPITISSLGLTAGDTVNFKQDMKIFDGSGIGGLRLEFFNGGDLVGNTGKLYPDLIGDGSTWETYSFEVTVPAGATHVKMLPLGIAGSSVGFDTITVGEGTTPPDPTADSTEIQLVFGRLFRWNRGSSASNFFQPQSSPDQVTWTNLGPAFTGSTSGQGFDPSNAPFYRILESSTTSGEALTNGGFEDTDFGDPACPLEWVCFSPTGQVPELIDTDAFSGSKSVRLAVQNDASPTPHQSEIQHNVAASGSFIEPGTSYDFSFRAKQISSGVSYVQNYRLQWLNDVGAIVSEAFGFTAFNGGTGGWAEITRTGLVAPDGAVTAYIQIFGATGAIAGEDAKGEVLIDDLSLVSAAGGDGRTTVVSVFGIEAGVGIEFPTQSDRFYQAGISFNLEEFDDLGPLFEGNGERAAIGSQYDEENYFFRVIETE
ncbi:MAG: hypothetical protein QMC24_09155 [Akkermansiaceae bacterium]|jgi:hypothetical protein